MKQPKITAKSDSDCLISDDCIRIADLPDRRSINVFQNTHRIFEGRDVRRGTFFPYFDLGSLRMTKPICGISEQHLIRLILSFKPFG